MVFMSDSDYGVVSRFRGVLDRIDEAWERDKLENDGKVRSEGVDGRVSLVSISLSL